MTKIMTRQGGQNSTISRWWKFSGATAGHGADVSVTARRLQNLPAAVPQHALLTGKNVLAADVVQVLQKLACLAAGGWIAGRLRHDLEGARGAGSAGSNGGWLAAIDAAQGSSRQAE